MRPTAFSWMLCCMEAGQALLMPGMQLANDRYTTRTNSGAFARPLVLFHVLCGMGGEATSR